MISASDTEDYVPAKRLFNIDVSHGVLAAVILFWGIVIGMLMSTEYLAQPFVWRHWALSDVLAGWLRVVADRLLVAVTIASALAGASIVRLRGRETRAAVLAGALVAGAVAGEALQTFVDPFAAPLGWAVVGGRLLQWMLISATAIGIAASWRLNSESASESSHASVLDARFRKVLAALRLEALQRQIEPHFLFNTLATIRGFRQSAPGEGLALLERLFDYVTLVFSASLDKPSTLGDEMDLVLAYLDVCAVRMGPRLKVVDEIDAGLRALPFPPLMLGTLVENAVRHGVDRKAEGGTITLTARVIADRFEVGVVDDGVGLCGESGAGLGLANLTARLRALHGDRASFHLDAERAQGVHATIRLPYALVG